MFIAALPTSNADITLVKPDVERDAPLSVGWLDGSTGRKTLRLMGVAEAQNHPTSLAEEVERVRNFLGKDDQYNWMIQKKGEIIGSVWVDLQPSAELEAPSISIMLGDVSARGHGVGQTAMQAVIDFLLSHEHEIIHSRHTIENVASGSLLRKLRFTDNGEPYTSGKDGLLWQNLILKPTAEL